MLDTETTGTDPAVHRVVEIGVVLWSIRHGTTLAAWSDLVRHPTNEAESVNRIPIGSLQLGLEPAAALQRLRRFVERADAIVAHKADFDRSFLPELGKPWICSQEDIAWPMSKPGASLVNVALAHGVAVVSAHRALTDCFLITRVLERMIELGVCIDSLIEKAMRPAGRFVVADGSYDLVRNELVKAHGFKWDVERRQWSRRMALEDAAGLPFAVRRIDEVVSEPVRSEAVATTETSEAATTVTSESTVAA